MIKRDQAWWLLCVGFFLALSGCVNLNFDTYCSLHPGACGDADCTVTPSTDSGSDSTLIEDSSEVGDESGGDADGVEASTDALLDVSGDAASDVASDADTGPTLPYVGTTLCHPSPTDAGFPHSKVFTEVADGVPPRVVAFSTFGGSTLWSYNAPLDSTQIKVLRRDTNQDVWALTDAPTVFRIRASVDCNVDLVFTLPSTPTDVVSNGTLVWFLYAGGAWEYALPSMTLQHTYAFFGGKKLAYDDMTGTTLVLSQLSGSNIHTLSGGTSTLLTLGNWSSICAGHGFLWALNSAQKVDAIPIADTASAVTITLAKPSPSLMSCSYDPYAADLRLLVLATLPDGSSDLETMLGAPPATWIQHWSPKVWAFDSFVGTGWVDDTGTAHAIDNDGALDFTLATHDRFAPVAVTP